MSSAPVSDRVLILIAYHFPPDPVIGAARPYRFYKYLKRLGYRVHVITASPQSGVKQEGVEYVPDPFLSVRRDAGWHRKLDWKDEFGWQTERAVRKLLLPGVLGMRWAYGVGSAAHQILRKHPNACVMSTSPPFGAHYAAWRIARTRRIPWIADFRDPFGGVSLAMGGLNIFQKQLFNWLEKRVIQSADLVIANTDSIAEEWKRKHRAHAAKIQLIWNGFDPENPMTALPLPERKFKVLSHVGELYAGRTVTPVLDSVSRLVYDGQLKARDIRVVIMGPAKASALPDEESLRFYQDQGWLELSTDPVPQEKAKQITQTSDGLLLIQPQSAVQVPGKLYEYLQIGRPILAFVMHDSPIERILEKSGVPYRCVYPDSDPADMDFTIDEFFKMPSDVAAPSEWFVENFRAENQAKELARLIGSLHPPVE